MLTEMVVFLLLYAALAFNDLVPVYQANDKKAVITCTAIFALAFVLQLLIILGVELPRYADLLEGALKAVTGYSRGK